MGATHAGSADRPRGTGRHPEGVRGWLPAMLEGSGADASRHGGAHLWLSEAGHVSVSTGLESARVASRLVFTAIWTDVGQPDCLALLSLSLSLSLSLRGSLHQWTCTVHSSCSD